MEISLKIIATPPLKRDNYEHSIEKKRENIEKDILKIQT
jgi:hypothetical protein